MVTVLHVGIKFTYWLDMRNKVSSFPFSHRMVALEEHCSAWDLYCFFCLYTLQNRVPLKNQDFLNLWLSLTVSRTAKKEELLELETLPMFWKHTWAQAWNKGQFPAPVLAEDHTTTLYGTRGEKKAKGKGQLESCVGSQEYNTVEWSGVSVDFSKRISTENLDTS